VCDLTNLHYSPSAAQMAKYVRYLFNLQHNTGKVITEQRVRLNVYAEQATLMSHAMERLERESATLCRGTCESLEKDLELQVTYRRLSEAEHGLNYTRQ
jgi:hypothetical protein